MKSLSWFILAISAMTIPLGFGYMAFLLMSKGASGWGWLIFLAFCSLCTRVKIGEGGETKKTTREEAEQLP